MARRNRDLVQILDEHERAIRRLRQSLARAGGGVADHGALTGLGDDDHSQYALLDGSNMPFSSDVTIRGALGDDGLTIWNTSGWGSIEVGGTLGSYLDFKNAEADDFDMRLILTGDNELRLDGGIFVVTGNVEPTADNTHDLGSSARAWEEGWINQIRAYGLQDENGNQKLDLSLMQFTGHLDPVTDNTYDLGDATLSWRQLYLHTLSDEAGAQVLDLNVCRFHKHVDPGANNTYDLGDSALTWRSLYVYAIYDEDGSIRIDMQGSPGTLFYNESSVLKMSISGSFVKFHDELYGTSAMTSTGSTSYKSIVHNAGTYQFYRFTSRRSMKKNIKDMDPALSDKLHDLTLRTFDMRKAFQTGDDFADFGQHGLIADEVHAVYGDQAAAPGEDGLPDGWSDKFMVVMLLGEAQTAKRERIAQDARIAKLEAALHRLNT